MKKPSSKIRDEIAKLQEQLKLAETREAERIGRVALKAGLGDIEIDEAELQAAFEDVAKRFRGGQGEESATTGGRRPPATAADKRRPRRTSLARARAAVVRLERMARTMTSDARKKDTREKIELGGLIVKAGLRYEKRALLLGALIDIARRIEGNEDERSRLTAIGVEAFGNDDQ